MAMLLRECLVKKRKIIIILIVVMILILAYGYHRFTYNKITDSVKDIIELTFTPMPKQTLTEGLPKKEWIKGKSIYFGNLSDRIEATIGDYIFSVDKTVVDNKLIHGVLTCSYYNDETIKNIDNNLVVYEKVKDVAVISEKEAYERITEGKFTYRKDIGVINTIEINEVAADYRLDSKGFFQPVYIFNTLINDETYSIVVPALAK